jgi:serine/threonine-protein kinase
MTYDQAAQALSAKGFTATRSDDYSDTVPADQSIGTNPPGGTVVQRGSSVAVVMSKGPQLVTVPDLTGKTLDAAQAALVALGLTPDTVGYLPGRLVLRTTPAANQQVKKGTTVTLVF